MTADILARFGSEYQDYHRISAGRRRQQQRVLTEFAATLDGRSLVEGTGDDVQAYAGSMLAGGYHVNTVRKHLNMIRPFYSWCYAVRLIDADTYLRIKEVKNPRGSTDQTQPNPYTQDELDAFWVALDQRFPKLPSSGKGSRAFQRWLTGKGPWSRVWRHAMRLQIEAMVRLALDCGLRRHEIFNLSVNDLHYDNEYVVVYGKADPNTGQKKLRTVPFTQAARAAITTWLEFRALMRPDHDRPWLSCYADAATKPMWETRFNDLLHDTLGGEFTWHRFRHTCATEWLRAGAELETVSKLLGHATLQQTLCYTEILKSDLAKKLARVETIFSERVMNRAA